MASPDLTQYVDLTIDDRSPQDIFEAALAQMQIDFPDWVPREGNVEIVLLETLALMLSETVFAINRIPDGVVEAILQMFGIVRDSGAFATTSVKFNMSGTNGYTIPAKTNIGVQPLDGGELVVFQTDSELEIAAAVDFGIVTATATELTSRCNGLAAGTSVELIDSNSFVDDGVLAAAISDGRDPEEDADYLNRAIARLQRLSDTLVTPNDFRIAMLEYPFVTRCVVLDQYDPDFPADVTPGFVTACAYGIGAVLSGSQKAQIETDIGFQKQVNLEFRIIDTAVEEINVQAVVATLRGYIGSEVVNAVETTLRAYLNPDTWVSGSTVRLNELIQVISNVEGVDYIDSITEPATDVELAFIGNLPKVGDLTISSVPSEVL